MLRGRLGLPILGALAFLCALLILFGALLGDDLQGLRLGLFPLIIAHDLGDIGAKAAFLSHHHAAVFRVFAQLAPALRGSKELFRQLFIQPIRGHRLREVGALVFHAAVLVGADRALDIGPVAADAHEDLAALRIGIELERVDLAGINGLEVDIDKRFQPAMPRDGRRLVLVGLSVAKVKTVEPVRAIFRAGGNRVQLIFHGRGEVIIHQLGEVFLQEAHHGEGYPRGNQGVAARDHVAAVLDGLDDGGIRRRAPDAQVFHLFHQAGFGIARRRVGGVAFCRDLFGLQIAALLQVRQAVLALLARILVGAVSLQETREGNGAAGCRELDIIGAIIRGRGAGDRHLHGGALGIGHLRGHGALPN